MRGRTDIVRKQRQRARLRVVIQHFNLLQPRGALRVVDLTQIQDVSINRSRATRRFSAMLK